MPILMPEQKSYESTPLGTHIATCYQVIDLGSQISDFANERGERDVHRRVRFSWELPNAQMKDGRPFSIGKDYTLSSNEKANLVSDVNAWRGKPFTPAEFGAFDLERLVGHSCLLQVVEKISKKGKPYTKVGAIMALPTGQKSLPLINPPLKFSLDNFDRAAFDLIPQYWQAMIKSSPEYKELFGNEEQPTTDQGSELPQSEEVPF